MNLKLVLTPNPSDQPWKLVIKAAVALNSGICGSKLRCAVVRRTMVALVSCSLMRAKDSSPHQHTTPQTNDSKIEGWQRMRETYGANSL